jgi:hypothetical protein
MFSTLEWYTREVKTLMRTYEEKEFFSGTEEISIFLVAQKEFSHMF